MQAYKGLYEDQLQTQHASAESYRSLTRGYSRLSADNKALRRETATVAAVAAAAGDAAGNAAALITPSAEMQRTTGAGSGKKERRDQARGSDGGSGAGAESSVAARAYAVTAAESAAAVATAASAVAAAAGALAEATTSGLPTDDQGSAAPTPSPVDKEEGDGAGAGAAAERDDSKGSFGKSSSRDRAASSFGSAGTHRPSTAETLACSPYSEKADTPPPTTTGEFATATATATTEKNGGTAGSETGGAAFVEGQAPPADYSLARQQASSRNAARAHGGDGGGGGSGGRTTKSYAFLQTPGEEDEDEDFSPWTGICVSSAGAASPKPQDGTSPTRRGRGTPKPDERSGARSEAGVPRPTKAVPPVEPAPRWRGRSVGPGRLLASSASWAENVDVEAPKRSSSPVPLRRGRWGECVTDGSWGGAEVGAEGGARGDGCSRIEPSSRIRPHSI